MSRCRQINTKGLFCGKPANGPFCKVHEAMFKKTQEKNKNSMEEEYIPKPKMMKYACSNTSASDDPARKVKFTKNNQPKNEHKDETGMQILGMKKETIKPRKVKIIEMAKEEQEPSKAEQEVNMVAIYRKEKSLHGHSLDVLKSGLQKYIRRGNIEGAMYCLGELDSFSDCEGGERIRTNMMHRLMIIFMEDVGLGGILSWRKIDELVFAWIKDRSRTDLIQKLVFLMCKSKKTRACSFARAYSKTLQKTEESFESQIKTSNYLCIRSLLDRLNEKSLIKDYKQVADEMKRAGVQNMDIAMKWIREIRTIERPLFFLLPLLHFLFGGYELEEVDFKEDLNWIGHKKTEKWVFEEYVFDKHTKNGNRDRKYFVEVSSKVENEIFLLPESFIQAYKNPENLKVNDNVLNETDYELVIRCQLVCTNKKTDTVIARSPESKNIVFLKGPFKTEEPINFFLKMQDEKKSRGIPYLKGKLIYLKANRWSSTPLGLRNELDTSRAWPYLECETVFDELDIKTKIKTSTLWPETVVMDCEAMKLTVNPLKLKDTQLDDYVKLVLFRNEFKIGDFADRNFLLGKDGRVYSVDEEGSSKENFDLEKQLKKKRYELVMRHK